MTIDEAIEQEREQAKMYKFEYEGECTFYGTKFVDEHSGDFDCIKKMHEHEQLAEWLEELKCYKNDNDFSDYAERLHKIAFNSGYNKAIDDFTNWLCEKYEVFEPENDGYTLYGDMKYHSKEELLNEFLAR